MANSELQCNGLLFEGINPQPALEETVLVIGSPGKYSCKYLVEGLCIAGTNIAGPDGRKFKFTYCQGPKIRPIIGTV